MLPQEMLTILRSLLVHFQTRSFLDNKVMISGSIHLQFLQGHSLHAESIADKCDRLHSAIELCKHVLMSFISEKLLSTEAIDTGIDKLMVAILLKLEKMCWKKLFNQKLEQP